MTDPMTTGKELYEQKKQQKEQLKHGEQRKENLARAPKKIGSYLLYVIIGIGIIGGFWWFITSIPHLPPTTDVGHIETSPLSHILTQPMPENIQKHMLEHADGAGPSGIIIQYNCDDFVCEPNLIDELAVLVRQYPENVYLAPNNYDGKIILTKLGDMKILDKFDEEAIRDFIGR